MKLLTFVLLVFCQDLRGLPLDKIVLPKQFKIEVFASHIPGARAMALSPSGTLFVGSRDEGKVYAIRNGRTFEIARRLRMPVGVVYHQGDLFVSAVNQILKFPNVEMDLNHPPKPQVVYDKLPSDTHHGWKYLALGPDRKLYFSIGAPCNTCLKEDPRYASLARINLDGSDFELIASGVRNSVGLAFHPLTKTLWFTDNGRDLMGDDVPPCELNRLDKLGENFGYPYCHGGSVEDREFTQRKCSEFKAPAMPLGAHVAPLGLAFYTGKMFPKEYRNQLFIAEHGSWNRSKKSGYRITLVKLNGEKAISYEPFATGWLDEKTQEAWGRPVDVLVTLDGALLVSDDFSGTIYKITHQPTQK